MTASISESELERLRQIEKLAREAVRPNPPEKHREALTALREFLARQESYSEQDVRRGAVTQQIVPKDE